MLIVACLEIFKTGEKLASGAHHHLSQQQLINVLCSSLAPFRDTTLTKRNEMNNNAELRQAENKRQYYKSQKIEIIKKIWSEIS